MGKLYFFFDRDRGPQNRSMARWIFLRALGGVYFAAFFALLFQVLGLVGSRGVLPAGEFLEAMRQFGPERLWLVPSLFWWSGSDHALKAVVLLGLLASVLVIGNILPRLSLLVCWICFLSFIAVSQDFGRYQSDGMLLEAGFLALLIAPRGFQPGLGTDSPPVRIAWYLLLWEWFRIYFESGLVKLLSGDPAWRHLTAMYEYYQNGPLPTWIGWYLQQMPFTVHRLVAAATLAMELGLIWLAFLPRRWRLACFVTVTCWQVGVIATANYAFLNYLVLILGVLLLDDAMLRKLLPRGWRKHLPEEPPSYLPPAEGLSAAEPGRSRPGLRQGLRPGSRPGLRRHPREVVRAVRIALTTVLLCTIAYATTVPLLEMLLPRLPFPGAPMRVLEPFRIANTYGLFAVMTPHRYEIEFQGSNDGERWLVYPFRYKPQDPHDRPRIYAPYQPRFDWNLWFASLTDWQQEPIVPRTEIRLLEGSPQVLGLFAGDPFAGRPPRYVRAVLYQYWFATPAEKQQHHVWWRRELLGTYAPTLTRQPDGKFAAVALPSLSGAPQ